MLIETLKENLDDFINEQYLNELSVNSLKAHKNSIIKFIDFLHNKEIENINKNHMIEYRKYLDTISESVNSKNLWIIALNKYLKWLNYNDLCLHQIKVKKKFYADYNLSLIDYKRLLRTAKKEERDILLTDTLARELRKYCRKNKITSGYIFKSPKIEGKMISKSCIWKHLKKITGMARVNKKAVHAHSFRHLFADVFLDKYPDHVLALAEYLGHNSLETTRIYAKKTLKQQKQMFSKLDF